MVGEFSLWLIDANFGLLVSAFGNGEAEAVEIRAEEAGARAGGCGNFCNALIVVGGVLFDDVDETFAAGDIDAFAFGIVEQIVGVAGDRKVGNGFAGFGVEDDEP